MLYVAGELFGYRSCYELAYASQQQSPMFRSLRQSQKIRLRLGGSSDPFESFPEKPRGMRKSKKLKEDIITEVKSLRLNQNCSGRVFCRNMARGRRLPSQSWKTFLQNYAEAIAAIQSFVQAVAYSSGRDRSASQVLFNC